MEITRKVSVGKPPDQVWAFLSDVRAVAECVPGLHLLEERADGTYIGTFEVKLGPMSAKLQGEGTLRRDDQTRSGVLEGKGVDRRGGSRVKGVMRYELVEEARGTGIEVHADVMLSGPLAQVGRTGIIEDVARALTSEFAANLEARLGGQSESPAGSPGQEAPIIDPSPTAQGTKAPPQPFDAGRAVSGALWHRLLEFLRGLLKGLGRKPN